MEAELEVIGGAQFANEDVELDGKEFDTCAIVNCRLIYRGGAPFIFTRTSPVNSEIVFEDAAMATMNALAVMHRCGMHEFVEMIFERVRNPFQSTVQ
jgi:hypothetical protein